MTSTHRKSFFDSWGDVTLSNLVEIQSDSYNKFLQKDVFPEKRKKEGLQELFEDVFPIYSYDERSKIEFISYRFSSPRYSMEECLERGITYEAAIHALFKLSDDSGIKEEEVFVGYFPLMTDESSFIINGSERVLVSQIHRSPGIYFEREGLKNKKDNSSVLSFKIMPYRGSWLVARLEESDLIYMYMEKNKKRRKVLATTFLRAIGLSKNVDILEKFYEIEKISINEKDVESVVGNIVVSSVYDSNNSIIISSGDSLTTSTVMQAIKSGINEFEIAKGASASDPIIKMIRKDPVNNHKDALKYCFRKMYPDDPATLSNARFGLMRFFFDKNRYSLGTVGRYKINKSLGLPTDDASLENVLLTQEDLILAVKKLLEAKNKKGNFKLDDIDDLSNRRIRLCGELVYNQCKIGFMRIEKVVKEKLSVSDMSVDSITPGRLFSSKVMTVALKELFARSQLSQFMDHTNPLSEISHKRRLSALGIGGIQRERAGLDVRDVHPSHYGRICPIETPEGPSIGLITSLALYSKINRFGFIETPYFEVKNGKISKEFKYYASDEESGKNIAQAITKIDSQGKILDEVCLVRRDSEIMEVPRSKVNLIEVNSSQLFSAGANLIPFLENDDTNRALMGANMQRQAVPVMNPESPIVGTGFEYKIAKDAGAVVVAEEDCTVVHVDGKCIVVENGERKKNTFHLKKYKRSNSGTCLNYIPIVTKGTVLKKGDVIADGSCSSKGELSLGKNILVAFMPYFGKNFEDAIVISEEVIKNDVFTSVRVEKLEIIARDTKLGQEEITRDIPNISEENVRNLDENGIIKIGSRVRTGDIIVGKVTPKIEGDLSPEERFLRAIFKDKAQNVKDTSLVAPLGVDGVVVDVRVFSRKDRTNRTDDVMISESETIKNKKKDYKKSLDEIQKKSFEKISNLIQDRKAPEVLLHRVNGEILLEKGKEITKEHVEKIISIGSEDILDMNNKMYLEIRNLLRELEQEISDLEVKHKQVVDGIKKGDPYLESGVLKHIVVHIAHKSPLEVGDKMAGRHGNKGVLSSIVSVEDMPYMSNGSSVQMILSTLGVHSRMNLGQLNEVRLGRAGNKLNQKYSCPVFRGLEDAKVESLLEESGLPTDGKEFLYNGKTGDRFINAAVVGYMYMLRLNHFIADKMHARATGPYSFITQQPLGGKSRAGGQRFGEMEFWAAEAYGAANLLLEMLTVKSDDVAGRAMIYQNIVKGEPILKTTQTESLSVLTKELMGLCLEVKLENSAKDESNNSGNIRHVIDSESYDEDTVKCNKFDKLTLKLASEEVIRNVWSHGEVKKAETINYRTMRPEVGGLFCEKVFGPTKDWECSCGKHKKVKHKGVVCDRCGVEVNVARVRRERMGHIDLAIPVIHIWLLKNVPSRLGHLLGLPVSSLESIVYYEQYVVIDPKETNLVRKQLLSQQEYINLVDKYGSEGFEASIGGEAIKKLINSEDLQLVETELKHAVKQARSVQARMKLARRLRTIDGFLKSGNSLSSLVLSCIPVIPPDIRPLIKLEGGRFATSDINDLYRRLIYRNLRLKQIIKMQKTPEVIVRNEKRLLQEAVDGLFDNGRRNTAIAGSGNKILKPIAQSLRGKHGRFRQNLLGKRVDYSGRSVIVVGPELKINQCGLPKDMAIQIFEPFIVRQLRILGKARTVRSARRIIQRKTKEVWEVIESITNNHTVILNRAPTLHRLSIQSFKPVLVEGKAIRLHPLVCSAFNADFDGDQMAVHLPLSVEAQIESRLFMMSGDNIFLPASGKPIAMPTREMTLGVYSLMVDPMYSPEEDGKKLKVFNSCKEVQSALSYINSDYQTIIKNGKEEDYLGYGIFLHEKIALFHDSVLIHTTPGRVLFNSIVPAELGFQNYVMSQNKLSDLIMLCYTKLGLERTAVFLDDLKDLGFSASTDFCISMGLNDICKPSEKKKILEKASKQVNKINDQLESGIITEGEAESRIISTWTSASDEISDNLFKELEKVNNRTMNPLNVILSSGARGNKSQIKQLGGMRGLVAKPSGEIIPFPVRGSFREGLSPIEIFISTHGGRKGLADTALKTADAGYLTRRLVDVSQEIIIREDDCFAISGISVSSIQNMQEESLPLSSRIKGRVLVSDVVNIKTKSVIAKAGTLVCDNIAAEIEEAGVKTVEIRSPLTCLTNRGVCSKCYGVNLADGKVAVPGEAVGIIAAQSIGEPGTQLTMRTFHLGGVASTELSPQWIIEKGGVIVYKELRSINLVNEEGKEYALLSGRSGSVCVVEDINKTNDEYVELIKSNYITPLEEFKAEIGTKVFVKPGEIVKPGELIADVETDSVPIIAEQDGIIEYKDLVEGVTIENMVSASSRTETVVKHYSESLCPIINILNSEKEVIGSYPLPTGAIISSEDNSKVSQGEYIARIPRSSIKSQDITGGLARVAEIFEARKPSQQAEIAEIEGRIEFRGVQKGKRVIAIIDQDDDSIEFEHLIPMNKQLIVHSNDIVRSGQQLTNGIASIDDILRICGVKYLQRNLVDQIQEVYKLQGVEINDKHIEVIVRKMMEKLSVVDHGDATKLIFGDEITRKEFEKINEEIVKEGGRPAKAKPMLLGITQAALNTDSLISSASFQNPTQGLLDGAMRGSEDHLVGCKENIIVANKMPAGTGFNSKKHGNIISSYNPWDEQFDDECHWENKINLLSKSMESKKHDVLGVKKEESII